jgi:hypothetical protein
VAVSLRAYDEDVAMDWANRPQWVNQIGTSLGTAAGAATVAALATNPIGWGIIGSMVLAAAAAGGLVLLAGTDKDDQLGYLDALVPACGPPDKMRTWRFA